MSIEFNCVGYRGFGGGVGGVVGRMRSGVLLLLSALVPLVAGPSSRPSSLSSLSVYAMRRGADSSAESSSSFNVSAVGLLLAEGGGTGGEKLGCGEDGGGSVMVDDVMLRNGERDDGASLKMLRSWIGLENWGLFESGCLKFRRTQPLSRDSCDSFIEWHTMYATIKDSVAKILNLGVDRSR